MDLDKYFKRATDVKKASKLTLPNYDVFRAKHTIISEIDEEDREGAPYRTVGATTIDDMVKTIQRMNKDVVALMDENVALLKSLSRFQKGYLRRERLLWQLKIGTWLITLVYAYYYCITSGIISKIYG